MSWEKGGRWEVGNSAVASAIQLSTGINFCMEVRAPLTHVIHGHLPNYVTNPRIHFDIEPIYECHQ